MLSKYNQMGSCFEDLIVRNMMAQSKFNLDIYLFKYNIVALKYHSAF
jgi:hypothetical protein